MTSITEERKVIHRFESFLLGKCRCGCNKDIEIINKSKNLKKFHIGHNFNLKGEKSIGWKGGESKNDRKYTLVYYPDHPFHDSHKHVRLHRLVMEKHLGRYLEKYEHIHHIDGNPENNELSNLKIVIGNKEHRKEHWIDVSGRICFNCNSNITYIKSNGRPQWCKNKIDKCICKKCWQIEYYDKSKTKL